MWRVGVLVILFHMRSTEWERSIAELFNLEQFDAMMITMITNADHHHIRVF